MGLAKRKSGSTEAIEVVVAILAVVFLFSLIGFLDLSPIADSIQVTVETGEVQAADSSQTAPADEMTAGQTEEAADGQTESGAMMEEPAAEEPPAEGGQEQAGQTEHLVSGTSLSSGVSEFEVMGDE